MDDSQDTRLPESQPDESFSHHLDDHFVHDHFAFNVDHHIHFDERLVHGHFASDNGDDSPCDEAYGQHDGESFVDAQSEGVYDDNQVEES
jgi:hypothetical protein